MFQIIIIAKDRYQEVIDVVNSLGFIKLKVSRVLAEGNGGGLLISIIKHTISVRGYKADAVFYDLTDDEEENICAQMSSLYHQTLPVNNFIERCKLWKNTITDVR